MSDKEWENFGYDTQEPCCVCGKKGDNKIEPRFGYIVCKEHYKLSPIEISKVVSTKTALGGCMEREYKIEITMNSHPWDNKYKPYFWCIMVYNREWCNSGQCGWAETPQQAWEDATESYNMFFKDRA